MTDAPNEQNEGELPETEQIFRYWMELRDLQSGSTRILPLTAMRRIHLEKKRQHELPKPSEELLQLKDGSIVLEAKNLEDLAAKLQRSHPDGE